MISTVSLREYLRLLRAYHAASSHVGDLDGCENGECARGKRVAGRAALPGAIRRMMAKAKDELGVEREAT